MELFHTLNRGVDKRKIFLNDRDRLRFINNLYVLNDEARVNNVYYHFTKNNDIASHYVKSQLIHIHAFCFFFNHYHLLLSSIIENGISKFMKKINMAYAKYFNEKYDRVGTLFQGRYKSVHIEKEAHFIHIPIYIHCNPLDMFSPEWRDKKLNNLSQAVNFLNNYRWSSHLDYSGEVNFPSIISSNFLSDYFGGVNGYINKMSGWLGDLNLESMNQYE